MNAGILTQTNPLLDGVTRRFGCRVMSLLAIPQYYLGLPLASDRAMEIIEAGRRIPEVILPNSRAGTEEHWLINQGFRALGHPELRGRQVGRMKGNRPVFWNSPGQWQYIIAHWVTLGADGHFTLFDNADHEIFDPWDPDEAVGVPGLPDNYVIRKRLVDKRLLYRVWRV